MSKNYIVAGGSSGIGLAIVDQLLRDKNRVWAISRTRGALPKNELLTHLTADLTQENTDLSQLPEEIHGLVYCPGSINLKPFRSLRPATFLEDFEINVVGAVRVLQAAYRGLKKAENSSVVLFSTVAVAQGMPFHSSVAAAKGAIEGLTRSLAAEWAPHIRVNCLAPSLTDTPLAASLLSSTEKREKSAQRHPLQQIGQPDDLAGFACFLLSEKTTWVSGQIIGVDGGMSSLRV